MAATVYLSILGEAKHQSESSEGHSEPRRNYCRRFLFPSAPLKVFLMLLFVAMETDSLSVALVTVLVASHPLLGAEEPLHNPLCSVFRKGLVSSLAGQNKYPNVSVCKKRNKISTSYYFAWILLVKFEDISHYFSLLIAVSYYHAGRLRIVLQSLYFSKDITFNE